MSLHEFNGIQERLKSIADPIGFLVNLFAHSPVAFGVWTADGHPLLTNAAFMDLFRVEPPPEYNVLEDELLEANGMLALFKRAFAGQTVHVPTYWYDPRELTSISVTEGRRVAISMTIFPLFKPTGEIEYVAATYKDETEIMLAHEAVRQMNERLERDVQERTHQLSVANRELESFSYSVAHDLRAPLRGMSGFARILMEEHGAKLDDEGRGHLQRIHSNALLMGHLIDALLGLARVTRGEMHPTDIDLSALARSVAAPLAAAESGHLVELVVADDLRARIDPVLARTLLENLIGNAWKFTRDAQQPKVEIGSAPVEDGRAFYVRDNGVGFDMTRAHKLFQPFQRLHTTQDFPGSGVGLATCRRIVERHGGWIWAQSAPGHGATFFFTLPG
jgi:signal transduction histidine kinase